MRFEDLPRDWAQRPITDPDVLEGVVDLIATGQARDDGATYLLLCHPNRRLLQPVLLPDEPRRVAISAVRERVLLALSEAAGQGVRDVVIAIARPGRPTATPRDHDLRAAFEGVCRTAGLTLHAVAIAAPDAVAVLPAQRDSAAA